mgnify:CR=1 FL=1
MALVVQKYGGTSVADAERIRNVAGRIARARDSGVQIVVVVSAMGDTTDDLIGLARQITDNPPKREMDQLLATGEQQTIALTAIALHALGGNQRVRQKHGGGARPANQVDEQSRVHNHFTPRHLFNLPTATISA